MDTHVQTLHEKSAFICRHCNHNFAEKEDFNTHVKTHDKPKGRQKKKETDPLVTPVDIGNDIPNMMEVATNVIECTKCAFVFPEVLDLAAHMEQRHAAPSLTKPTTGINRENIVEIEDSTCKECGHEASDDTTLEKHRIDKHGASKQPSFKCHKCDYESDDTQAIDSHGRAKHGILKCELCDYQSEEKDILGKHMTTHTGPNILPCGVCEFETRKKATLDNHMDRKHKANSKVDTRVFNCGKCEKVFVGQLRFTYHICNPKSYRYPCDYNNCEFNGTDVSDIAKHIYDKHRRTVHSCQHCDDEFEDKSTLMEHIQAKHKEIAMLNSLFAQQSLLCESLNTLRQDLGNTIKTLIDGQNTMKTELLLIKEKATPAQEKEDTEEVIVVENPRETFADKTAKNVNQSKKDKTNKKTTEAIPKKNSNVPGHVLWIGDSHTNNLDRKVFEKQTKTKVDIGIAYTVDKDEDAKYPDRNFLKIVPEKLSKKQYDTLVLQGGCNEISNIAVKQDVTKEDVAVWQEKIRQSRTKLFNLAEDCLQRNSKLKNVIIVTSLPRYELEENDPNGLKSKLNQFANTLYTSLWMQKGCPENISIHDQNLNCLGKLRMKRFGNPGQFNPNGKPFDGIHMRGAMGVRHYTNSMTRIFAMQFPSLIIEWNPSQSQLSNYHDTCPQSEYRRRHLGFSHRNLNPNYQGERKQNFPPPQTNAFSQQSNSSRRRGFKSNNKQQNVYTESVYNIPTQNRFSENF